MKKPYRKKTTTRKKDETSADTASTSFKVKIRGKDNAVLSLREIEQGLYQAAKKLAALNMERAQWVTLYLNPVDENGERVSLNSANETTVYPYRSAADDHGA